uniref:Putative mediator of RNA polymerase II transcription subunit 8 n=1 Tax=Anthurium amnicola TaxID=1678845 RepID=A0A1D1YK23_9ARAE
MEVIGGVAVPGQNLQQQQQFQQQAPAQAPPPVKVERLNPALQQQLNLESVKTRAVGLFKAISRILEEFDAIARANAVPKWQDVLGQFSMVNMELFSIVEDIKKVSKAFVVYPKNVNAENATILPVMLSSKLLPEMEAEDNSKREQLLHGMQNLPIPMQIEKLKARIDMIGAACETAEKVISDARKSYGLGTRQGPTLIPTLDKAQAAKIQEQENLLRAAVNFGEGLRIPGDQRRPPSSLPMHLASVLPSSDGAHSLGDTSGVYQKNTPSSFTPGNVNTQGSIMQVPGTHGRSVPSPGVTPFDNASTPPLPHANSPRSSSNIMNTPSPQQQTQQQQRQKMMLPQNQPQLLAQQQLRQSSVSSVLGQNTMPQIHDLLQGQTQQKIQPVHGQHQMQYPQSLAQQIQNRQLQHNIAQNQMSQGSQLRSHLGQFAASANNTLFSSAQTSQNSQMYALSGGLPQRNIPSQILNDQMFNMGTSNPASMVGIQQHATQSGFGNITGNAQNLQTGLNPQNLQTTINAQNLQPSMNTQSLQSGMNAQSLQPGVNTQNLQAGLNAQNLQSVMNSQNLQSVMNTQSLHPGMNTQNLQSGMVTLQNSAQNPSYQQQRQQSQQ